MSANSRLEDARDELIAEFQNITTTNGYRTNAGNNVYGAIRPIDKIRAFPEIGIEMGQEVLERKDSGWNLIDSIVDVYVVGYVEANTSTDYDATELTLASEKLRHDMKRVIAAIWDQYAHTANSRWIITKKQQIAILPPMVLGEKRNRAAIQATFQIKILNQDSSFADAGLLGGDFAQTATTTHDGGTY